MIDKDVEMSDINTPATRPMAERFDSGERMDIDRVEIGHWFWITDTNYRGEETVWFGCVMEIGSNYVKLESSRASNGSYHTTRVHFDQFEKMLRYEPEHERVIAEKIAYWQAETARLLNEVTEVTRRLGIVPTSHIADQSGEGTNALVAVSAQADTTVYKNALILAKEETLPDLFRQVKDAHQSLANWMMAPSMTLLAQMGPMKNSVASVEDRIYTLSLYAGLTEEAVQIRDGEPANMMEKLRVMQRRLYMDEECLAEYEAGGMELKGIEAFDEWLAREENYTRLLPFDRCLAAFRVRRYEKQRNADTMWEAFVNIHIAKGDKMTFLYVRNGSQVWRINCAFDFGEKIIPDQSEFDPSQPMMVKMFAHTVDEIIPLSAWEAMRDEELEKKRLKEEWDLAHPDEEDGIRNPHGWMGTSMNHTHYAPFDPSNVYYDDVTKEISKKIKDYNRVAVILQGLFDRSLVLHPHPAVKVWDPASFTASIELVYDATTLTYGDPPDFEAYRKRLNASLNSTSLVTGQQDYWLRKEAEKENERRRRDWRDKNKFYVDRYQPYGNPGPGALAKAAEVKGKRVTFKWERQRQRESWEHGYNPVAASISVPASELLNVSAYKPGDFKQFFADPRTRREYLKWAPLMLVAEDHYAGKMCDDD